MNNTFVNIPVPAANGSGAAVDVSTMGAGKTIIVGGGFVASVTIEYATDLAGTVWAPVPGGTFDSSPGRVQIDLAAHWMRATTEAYKSGVPNADVGASGSGSTFVELVVGAPGPSVNIALMPALKTVVVADNFKGSIAIELSEDGVSWSQVMVFNDGGGQTLVVYGQFARARSSDGSTPSVWMGSASSEGTGPSDISAGSNLLVRPGSLPGGNVFRDLLSATAAASLIQGTKTIQFDDTIRYVSAASAKTLSAAVAGLVTLTDPNAPFNPLMIGQSITITGSTASIASAASAKTFTATPVTGVVSFFDPNASFTAEMVGHSIVIAGSTTPANNGTFLIQELTSATTIKYINLLAVTEAFPGTWTIAPNAGTFQIIGYISPTQITFANALGAVEVFGAGKSWTIGAVVIVQAGSYALSQAEFNGYGRAGITAVVVSVGGVASSSNGLASGGDVIFTGLAKIGGDLQINNFNALLPVLTLAAGNQVFEFGVGGVGDFPVLVNSGKPFINAAALLAGQQLVYRLVGGVQGSSPAIDFGASPAALTFTLLDSGRVHAGLIVGTNVLATLVVVNFGSGGTFLRQAGWAGLFVPVGSPAPAQNTTMPILRTSYLPQAVSQVATPPTTSIFSGASLGPNATWRFNTSTNAQVAAAGDGFVFAGGNVTLTDASGPWPTSVVGRSITIALATSAGNNGTFIVTASTPTTVTYANAAGVTEAPVVGVTTWTLTDTNQTLPRIRNTTPAIGSTALGGGGLEATGTFLFVKNELGGNTVKLTPDGATPDTTEGGAGPIVVPAGGSRVLQLDGISNWIIVAGYL